MAVTDLEQPFRVLIGEREILTNQHSISLCPTQSLTRILFCAGLNLMSPPAFAEVSDKILSVPGMWLQALLIGCAAILTGRFRWWLGLPFLVLPIVIALSTFGLRHASELGSAIIKERGESYFLNLYASAFLAAVLVGIGIWIGWRRRKAAKDSDDH